MACLTHVCRPCGRAWQSNKSEPCPECGSDDVADHSDETPDADDTAE